MGFDSCLRIVLGAAILTLPIVNSASAGGPAQMHSIKMKTAEVDTSGPNLSIFSAGKQSAGSHFYIVQFSGPVQEDWKRRITDYGAKFFGYLPEDAFIVKMDASTASVVSADHSVTWVGPYKPEFKLAPKKATLETTPAEAVSPGEALPPGGKKYTVKVFDGEDMAPIIKSLKALGATVEVVADNDGLNGKKLRVQMDDSMAAQAANIEQVEWVEEFFPKRLLNDVAVRIMNVTPVRTESFPNETGLTGTGQVVGIMDTGLDTGNTSNIHPAFAGTVSNGNSKIKEAVKALFNSSGTIFNNWSPDGWSDPSGHGTHTCGSLTGKPYMDISGIAYDAELVFQATLDPNNINNLLIPDLNSQAFPYAYDQGVRVHSNSWGGGAPGEYESFAQSADTFIWNHPDFVVCFAAGNSGVDNNGNGVIDPGSVTPPGTAKNIITVGATENYRPFSKSFVYGNFGYFNKPFVFDKVANNKKGMAAFSSRGPTADGRVKPDVVAPGTYVLSTKSSLAPIANYWAKASQLGYGVRYDAYFAADGGTSMATPLTAGAAALVRQYYTDVQGVSSPSAALIKATLISGAYNMAPGQYGTGRYREIHNPPDDSQGWGRVNVMDSITPPAPAKVRFVDSAGVNTEQTLSYGYEVIYTSVPVKVALVWSDYPTTLPAAKDLVNDLDLTVTGPDGNVYHGNQFNTSNSYSTPGATTFDNVNNVEVVNIKPSATGLLKIAVKGSNVPDGPQPFALVTNGAVASQDATVNFPLSITQEGGAVTLSANFSLGDIPMVKKPVTFYDQTGTGTPVKKGTVLTNALGVATLKFAAASGTHTANATTPAITAIGITPAPSTPAVPYTIGQVRQTSPGAVVETLPFALSWDASTYPEATAYEVQVYSSPIFPAALKDYATTASSAVSYTDLMLPGMVKYWRVRAVLPTGHSLYSATSKFTYKPVPVLELSPPVQIILNKVTLTTTVKDGSGVGIGGRKVYFYDNGVSEGYAVTKPDGTAGKTIAGTSGSTVQIVFKGDAKYSPAVSAPVILQ